jgi:hypothetical protein
MPDGYEGPAVVGRRQHQPQHHHRHVHADRHVDPTVTAWSDYNGQQASDNIALFSAAASRVHDLGLSFGGGWFFENGVTGPGSLTITNITVSP